MKKYMNFRIMVTLAVSLMLGTALATCVFATENLRFILFFACFSIFLMFLVVAFASKIKILFVLASVMLFFSLPFLNLYFKTKEYNQNLIFDGDAVTIYGKIYETDLEDETSIKFVLTDVSIIFESNVYEKDGKVAVYTSPNNFNLDDFVVGRYVSVEATPTYYYLDGSTSVSYYLNRDIFASCYAFYYNISFTDNYNITLRDSVQTTVYSYFKNLNSDYAELGFTMMFGDSAILSEDLVSIFRETGIAHLLAISGLHVSILIAIISFILKKLKTPKIFNFIFLGAVLGFYSYLCDFSASVVRACLMAMFAELALIRGKSYDNLSILSLTAILILLANPLKMFNVSFVLSFSAVLAIILLHSPIKRFLCKFFKEKFADVVALSLSVQCGLFLLFSYYFGEVNLLSVICNLISVPVIIICFVGLMICIIVSLIIPIISYVIAAYDYLVGLVVKFNYFIGSLNTTLTLANITIFYDIALKVMMFLVSDYTFFSKKKKISASLAMMVTCFLVCITI